MVDVKYSEFTLKTPPVSGNFVVGLDSAAALADQNIRIPVTDFAILSAANTFGDFNIALLIEKRSLSILERLEILSFFLFSKPVTSNAVFKSFFFVLYLGDKVINLSILFNLPEILDREGVTLFLIFHLGLISIF